MLELLGSIKEMLNDASSYKEVVLTDEIFNRWKSFGFLDGLEGELANKCALSFERLARYLLSGIVEENRFVETCSFPCTRRIIQVIGDDIMPEVVVNELDRIRKIFADLNREEWLREFEAHLTAFASDNIVYELIKSGEYKVVKAQVCDMIIKEETGGRNRFSCLFSYYIGNYILFDPE